MKQVKVSFHHHYVEAAIFNITRARYHSRQQSSGQWQPVLCEPPRNWALHTTFMRIWLHMEASPIYLLGNFRRAGMTETPHISSCKEFGNIFPQGMYFWRSWVTDSRLSAPCCRYMPVRSQLKSCVSILFSLGLEKNIMSRKCHTYFRRNCILWKYIPKPTAICYRMNRRYIQSLIHISKKTQPPWSSGTAFSRI